MGSGICAKAKFARCSFLSLALSLLADRRHDFRSRNSTPKISSSKLGRPSKSFKEASGWRPEGHLPDWPPSISAASEAEWITERRGGGLTRASLHSLVLLRNCRAGHLWTRSEGSPSCGFPFGTSLSLFSSVAPRAAITWGPQRARLGLTGLPGDRWPSGRGPPTGTGIMEPPVVGEGRPAELEAGLELRLGVERSRLWW